jgi:hypothetical protein
LRDEINNFVELFRGYEPEIAEISCCLTTANKFSVLHVGIGLIGLNMDKYKFVSQIITNKDDMTTLELEGIHKV